MKPSWLWFWAILGLAEERANELEQKISDQQDQIDGLQDEFDDLKSETDWGDDDPFDEGFDI